MPTARAYGYKQLRVGIRTINPTTQSSEGFEWVRYYRGISATGDSSFDDVVGRRISDPLEVVIKPPPSGGGFMLNTNRKMACKWVINRLLHRVITGECSQVLLAD